uniref:cadherin-12-like n=1 Tax=Maylandia zebra TaxID=106582 RepID=UPI000D30205E|nr:cadherin-12-like [Maylandia zebra]
MEACSENLPTFNSIFNLHVPESASLGAAVGRIQAQDLDVGSNARVEYAIVPGDEGNMFDIICNGQSQEGIIVLKNTLDYETQASYTFKVEAFNAELDPRFLHLGPFKDSVTVEINVLDVDEPPVFTTPYYSLDVYEDTPPGTIIGSVTAYDLDASSSAVRGMPTYSDLDIVFQRWCVPQQSKSSAPCYEQRHNYDADGSTKCKVTAHGLRVEVVA